MKSLAFCILAVLSVQVTQAQLFGPTGRVATPIFRAAAPAPGPSNAPIYSTTTTVLGAAIGGIIGSNSDKGTEGAALGGAVGLVIGQVLDRRSQKREAARQQAPQGPGIIPPVAASTPQMPSSDPASQSIPVIDPVTGLPIQNGQLQNPVLPSLPGFDPSKSAETPGSKASRLFGR
ncbi:MAG: glycine zipper domain-containing protein [Verrucomicrobiota bacterium]|jgi:predicted permease|nr:glycine zipper domain-containing protein [Verrucomicrobiota bacterium]|tara:strand:- start:220 stop:747 length:528 start_codon:yes stop_codon:yes gene_type:complete